LYELRTTSALPQIRVVDRTKREDNCESRTWHIPFHSEQVCSIHPGINEYYLSDKLRFSVSSPIMPPIVHTYDMETRCLDTHNDNEYDRKRRCELRDKFEVQRLFVPSKENEVEIPLTITHKKHITRHGRNPVLMFVYGAYGVHFKPEWVSELIPLLERGLTIAIAHVRGGGEKGNQWYDEGKLKRKHRSWEDFISCAEYLIDEGYTRPQLLAAHASSAGGLVLGVVANQRPDLFRAMVMRSPFLDVLTAMALPHLPLTVHEFEEWGDPSDDDVYEYMKSYSPRENVKGYDISGMADEEVMCRDFPSTLITVGLEDQRVQCWHSFNWVSAVRRVQFQLHEGSLGMHRVLLRASPGYGHFGPRSTWGQFGELALEAAFLNKELRLGWKVNPNV